MAWSVEEGQQVADWVLRIGERGAVEVALSRIWALRCAEDGELATYVGPHVGGWLRVRYAGDRPIGASFTPIRARAEGA